ncbi:restriction endonuclease subunit S [Ferirhizobium litorale]|uniref:Restriction endonuclease subunit S n=1 Tax=Ferirhizobium litorale TaxID=2927786 RepID=A0AAE3QJU0_9HYPH|nr:restriction endonuclease subunit S [Fererhizobium litorale]MDI7925230.1 restriction endonuclease subunit S [Fererhizobium litorale]
MSEPAFKRIELADIAERTSNSFVDGPFGSSLKSDEYTQAGIRLIQLQNIGINEWNDDNKKFISEQKFLSLQRHGAVPGDIAIAKMADPVARACIVPEASKQFVVVADCIRLRPDTTKFVPSFIVKAINSPYTRQEAEKKAIGSTRIRINLSTLKTVGCLVPPFDHQAKIAEILDTLDEAIRGTDAVIAKLKALKQGLMHDLLTRGIDANGNLRPLQSKAPHLYKESPLGWLPKEWEHLTVNELSRSSAIGPFGSDLVASDYRSEGVPVVFVRDIKPNNFSWRSNVFLDERKAQALLAHKVAAGDVVATKMGFPPCISAVYPSTMPDGIVTADVVCVRPKLNLVRPEWLSISLNSPNVQRQVDQITAGVTRPKVTLRDVRELKIALPEIHEQLAILERTLSIDNEIKGNGDILDKLRLQKSGLMDDLLTGRVPVTPLL